MTEAAELQDNKSPVVKPHNHHGPCIFTGFKEDKTLKKLSQVQKKTQTYFFKMKKEQTLLWKMLKEGAPKKIYNWDHHWLVCKIYLSRESCRAGLALWRKSDKYNWLNSPITTDNKLYIFSSTYFLTFCWLAIERYINQQITDY